MSLTRVGSSWFYTTSMSTFTGACLGAYNRAYVMKESDMSLYNIADVIVGTMNGALFGFGVGVFTPLIVTLTPSIIIIACKKNQFKNV
jgi:hypothetical protein